MKPHDCGNESDRRAAVPIHKLLEQRRSVRAWDSRPVPSADLEALFEAARRAPSNGNRQPWRFIVRTSAEGRLAMGGCLTRGNGWALAAPVLVTLVTRVTDGGMSNGIPYAFYDCGLAAMSLTVEAESRGLRVHQMAGWHREPLVRLLGLPDGVEPIAVIAVGYEGDVSQLPPELREKELRQRIRKPAEEVWAVDSWNASWA
jgi:nitroreductase